QPTYATLPHARTRLAPAHGAARQTRTSKKPGRVATTHAPTTNAAECLENACLTLTLTLTSLSACLFPAFRARFYGRHTPSSPDSTTREEENTHTHKTHKTHTHIRARVLHTQNTNETPSSTYPFSGGSHGGTGPLNLGGTAESFAHIVYCTGMKDGKKGLRLPANRRC
ncbi:unnamed protein product, partial [Ectocarpus fasciculatus]